MASKRSKTIISALTPTNDITKRGCRRPRLEKVIEPSHTDNIGHGNLQTDLNETLLSLYPVRRKQHPRQKTRQAQQEVLQPNMITLFNENETAIQNIAIQNIPSNRCLDEETRYSGYE